MKIPPKKEKKKKQGGNKKPVGRARKKVSGGEAEENIELESRSPTPTPPVLEPEVPIKLPTAVKEAESDVSNNDQEDTNDQSEEEPKHIPRLLDAAGTEDSRQPRLLY